MAHKLKLEKIDEIMFDVSGKNWGAQSYMKTYSDEWLVIFKINEEPKEYRSCFFLSQPYMKTYNSIVGYGLRVTFNILGKLKQICV